MTDIVSVPSGNFTPGAYAALQYPAALINAAWNQANQKFELFEAKMGLVTNISGTGWLDDTAAPTIAVDSINVGNLPVAPTIAVDSINVGNLSAAPTIAVDSINVGNLSVAPTIAVDSINVGNLSVAPTIAVDSINVGNLSAAPTIAVDSINVGNLPVAPTIAVDSINVGNLPVAPTIAVEQISSGTIYTSVADAVSPVEPTVTLPTEIAPETLVATFDDQQTALWNQLVDAIAAFRTTYFSTESAGYTAAETWLQDALSNCSGLPPCVASQMLSDDRDRINAEATRASDALMAKFAASRFPIPPGALVAGVTQIQNAAQSEIAASARKITVAGVERLHWVVDKLIGLRQLALNSAREYATTLASAFPVAGQVTSAAYEAQTRLIGVMAGYFNARTAAAELLTKNEQFNATNDIAVAEKNFQMALDAAEKNQATALAVAEKNTAFTVEVNAKNQAVGLSVAEKNQATALAVAGKNLDSALATMDRRMQAVMRELAAIAQMATSLYNNLHASSGTSYQVNGT